MVQGQGSSSNSFPRNSYINELPSADASVGDGPTIMGLMGSSSSNVVSGQENFSTGLVNGPGTNGTSILQDGDAVRVIRNIDLNAVYDGNGTDQNPPAIGSSDPVVISSGVAGYVLEDNNLVAGLPPDGRRLSCKRRAPEDTTGQLSLGGSSSSGQRDGNIEQRSGTGQGNANSSLSLSNLLNNHPNVSRSEQLVAGLGIGMEAQAENSQRNIRMSRTAIPGQNNALSSLNVSNPLNNHPHIDHSGQWGARPGIDMQAASAMPQTSNMVAQTGNAQRNIRMRRTVHQQNFAPANMVAWAPRNPQAQLPTHGAVHFPFNQFMNPSSLPVSVHTNPAPNYQQMLHPSQMNDVAWSMAGVPISGQVENSSSNLRHMMLSPELQTANMGHISTQWNHANVNPNFNRNIASASLSGPGSGVHQHNLADQYAQRVQDLVNDLQSRGQSNIRSIYPGVSAAPQGRDFPVRGGNARSSQMPFRSGSMMRAERQADGFLEAALASLAAARRRRRRRLASEVRNAFALARRGVALHFEDVMVIDRSMLINMPEEEEDALDDMRLDVDDMSYEELLALEEHIGDVSTGLSEEAITNNLRSRKFQSVTVEASAEREPCCICQEEYADGEDLGKLDCGHDFHFNCIKQWLVQKNSCPICKKTALAI